MSPAEFARTSMRFLNDVTRFARSLCRRDDDAEEVTQETYAHALAACGELRDEASLRSWLFRITYRVWVDRRRADATRGRFLVLEGGLDDMEQHSYGHLDDDVIRRADAALVRGALDAVPDELRVCVILVDVWGFTYDEVAGAVGIPIGTVRSRVARGRARLEAALARALDRPGSKGGVS